MKMQHDNMDRSAVKLKAIANIIIEMSFMTQAPRFNSMGGANDRNPGA